MLPYVDASVQWQHTDQNREPSGSQVKDWQKGSHELAQAAPAYQDELLIPQGSITSSSLAAAFSKECWEMKVWCQILHEKALLQVDLCYSAFAKGTGALSEIVA